MTEQTHASGVVCSDDPARIDFAVVHGYLSRSYWSPGISRPLVERAPFPERFVVIDRPDLCRQPDAPLTDA